jgi:hypothetical protein
MLKTIITTLLFLAASSANAQAPLIEMPPARPPMTRPVVNPPSFPTPGATPAGAGIEVPTPEGDVQVVPRSPNKRILPATKEAGLWAADGAPQAVLDNTSLFGVEIPFPDAAPTQFDKRHTSACVSSMNKAAYDTAQQATIAALPEGVRRCLAAQAYEFCTGSWQVASKARSTLSPDAAETIRKAYAHARGLVAKDCPGSGWDPKYEALLSALEKSWAQEFAKFALRKP